MAAGPLKGIRQPSLSTFSCCSGGATSGAQADADIKGKHVNISTPAMIVLVLLIKLLQIIEVNFITDK